MAGQKMHEWPLVALAVVATVFLYLIFGHP